MTKPTINAVRQRLNAPGSEFRPVDHRDAWRLLDALDAVARAALEPPTLPDECPDLDERIIGAIEQLVQERTEARTMAHEAATAALRAEEEEAKRKLAAMGVEPGWEPVPQERES